MAEAEPQGLRQELRERGFAVKAGLAPEEAARDPWAYVERLLGERPRMLERQPIKAVEGGRSFASTSRYTPLHTDSQLYDGGPPDLQIMACLRADEQGGSSTLLDAWALLEQIERGDAGLFRALFSEAVVHPFVFGDVAGPTAAIRGRALAFTHSPRFNEQAVGRRLEPWLSRVRPLERAVRAGETMLVDNRRMLHGRTAFSDTRREFTRLLVWLDQPLGRHERYESFAAREALRTEAATASATAEVRRRMGAAGAQNVGAEAKLQLVMAMLRGAAPGVLSARHRVPEGLLYTWRDEALRGALTALENHSPASDAVALAEALRRMGTPIA